MAATIRDLRWPRTRCLILPGHSRAAALERGLSEAVGEFVVVFGASASLSANFLAVSLQAFDQDAKLGLLTAATEPGTQLGRCEWIRIAGGFEVAGNENDPGLRRRMQARGHRVVVMPTRSQQAAPGEPRAGRERRQSPTLVAVAAAWLVQGRERVVCARTQHRSRTFDSPRHPGGGARIGARGRAGPAGLAELACHRSAAGAPSLADGLAERRLSAGRPLRVLLTVHAFPPRATAGVEVYTLRLAGALAERGHEVRVLSAVHDLGGAPGSIRRRSHQGVLVEEVVSIHARGTLEGTYADPDLEQAASRVLREFRPHIVHIQHLLNLAASIPKQARSQDARVLLTLHDYWLSCPRDGLRMKADLSLCERMDHAACGRCLQGSPYLVPAMQNRLSRWARKVGAGAGLQRLHAAAPRVTEAAMRLIRSANPPDAVDLAGAMDLRAERLREALGFVDLALAPTKFCAERAVEFGLSRDRLLVSAYGAVQGPTRPRAAGPRRRVGFIGTVGPHKGVHVLVEAFRAIADPGASLDIHGSLSVDPGYARRLRQVACRDPRIRWHGAFPEGGQGHVHETLDVLVVPSLWWENSPITALEALADGLAVVASRTGGVPEILEEDRTGLLVPPGDATALRVALEDVMAGRKLVEPLAPLPLKTVAAGARELEGLYQSLVADGRTL